jgi:hypothetical protein
MSTSFFQPFTYAHVKSLLAHLPAQSKTASFHIVRTSPHQDEGRHAESGKLQSPALLLRADSGEEGGSSGTRSMSGSTTTTTTAHPIQTEHTLAGSHDDVEHQKEGRNQTADFPLEGLFRLTQFTAQDVSTKGIGEHLRQELARKTFGTQPCRQESQEEQEMPVVGPGIYADLTAATWAIGKKWQLEFRRDLTNGTESGIFITGGDTIEALIKEMGSDEGLRTIVCACPDDITSIQPLGGCQSNTCILPIKMFRSFVFLSCRP